MNPRKPELRVIRQLFNIVEFVWWSQIVRFVPDVVRIEDAICLRKISPEMPHCLETVGSGVFKRSQHRHVHAEEKHFFETHVVQQGIEVNCRRVKERHIPKWQETARVVGIGIAV